MDARAGVVSAGPRHGDVMVQRRRWTEGKAVAAAAARASALALCAALALGGCAALLPSSQSAVTTGWSSYAEAAAAIAPLEPYRVGRADLHLLGLDPATNPAIAILSFSDLLQRFPAAALMEPEDLEPGLRECLRAGQRCSGYALDVRRTERRRIGNFWLDSLNFSRETEITGWRFNALFVFVDDRLVYRLTGGQPNIHETEHVRNPLGPLQGWGEALRPALK